MLQRVEVWVSGQERVWGPDRMPDINVVVEAETAAEALGKALDEASVNHTDVEQFNVFPEGA